MDQRVPADNSALLAECLQEYDRSFDRLAKLVQFIVQCLEGELKSHDILARVSGRVKSRASLKAKLQSWLTRPEKEAALKTRQDLYSVIGDLAAVRVMTYVEQDRNTVEMLARERFASPQHLPNYGWEKKEHTDRVHGNNRNFYRATHMQIALRAGDCSGPYENLSEDQCELQITSMLAHVWNEIEHDIGYKGAVRLSQAEYTALESLGLLTKAGDNIIASLITSFTERRHDAKTQAQRAAEHITDPDALGRFLQAHFGDKIGGRTMFFGDQTESLLKALQYLKLNHPNQIARVLAPTRMEEAVAKTSMDFMKFERATNTARQKFERDTADACLLVLFGLYGKKLAEEPYTGRGQKPRHLALAKRYQLWIESIQTRRK